MPLAYAGGFCLAKFNNTYVLPTLVWASKPKVDI